MATITTFDRTGATPLVIHPGDVFDVNLNQFYAETGAYKWTQRTTGLPNAVVNPNRTTTYLRGTVTENNIAANMCRLALVNTSGGSVSASEVTLSWQFVDDTAAPVPIPEPSRTDGTYTLPAVDGVVWKVDGNTKAAGTYTVPAWSADVTVRILPTIPTGTFDGTPETTVYTFTAAEQVQGTTPTTTLPAGVRVRVDLRSILPAGTFQASIKSGAWPTGLALTDANGTTSYSTAQVWLTGTTPEDGGPWTATVQPRDEGGDYIGGTRDLAFMLAGSTPPDTVIAAPAAKKNDTSYTLPAAEGVQWYVNGKPRNPGTYSMTPITERTTVSIVPEALPGYVFDTDPTPVVFTFDPPPPVDPEDPDPEDPAEPEDPDPEDPEPTDPEDPEPEDPRVEWDRLLDDDPQALYVAQKLAQRVARHVGVTAPSADELVIASGHVLVVLDYVRGYTRERGFTGYVPHRMLQSVIVAAAARLYTNPEQVTYYQSGDYSERPATMTGWTAAERSVLRRFRVVYA